MNIEEKLTPLTTFLGWKDTHTQIMSWFIENKEGTSRDIEHDLRLAQPIVSKSLLYLYTHKYITQTKIPPEGQGRPIYFYALTTSPNPVTNITSQVQQRLDTINTQIATLKTHKV